MKVALIPPFGLETYALGSHFHLALAMPSLMAHRPYVSTYRRACVSGDYLVVDNGTAEAEPVGADQLLEAAIILGAREIVLPDVICDGDTTVKKVKEFIDVYGLHAEDLVHQAVAQGASLGEVMRCITRLAKVEEVTVLGIPRHLLSTLNTPSVRIDLANWIEQEFPRRFTLHLLGTNAKVWPAEVKAAAKYAPYIRSVDTSMPFNYAIAGEYLTADTHGPKVERPRNYLTWDHSSRVQTKLVRANIATLLSWADSK